jgi:predicted nucleotide-binding protein
MTDAELRGRLLTHFYGLRLSNNGYVPVDELIIAGTERVSGDAIRGVCGQLSELGLIQWTNYIGDGPPIGSAKITVNGAKAVEHGSWAGVDITFPGRAPVAANKEGGLRRDTRLIEILLDKLELHPSEYGDVFILDGNDPHFRTEGYTSDQITYHLEQMREMGLLDSLGSQPAIGITFAGLSLAGEAMLERSRKKNAASALPPTSTTPPKAAEMSNKVFLVHGHDDAAKNEVALFLTTIGLEPIILHRMANGGRHLLTKFQEESKGASFAVVLMTPDDEGGPKATTSRRDRARQNVVFELGFFIGRLGSERVAALMKGDIERPSDFDGIAYIQLNASSQWKTELARELQHAGMPFDARKVLTA